MTATANSDAILAAHPIELYLGMDAVFSPDPWLSWEPETVLHSLQGEVSDEAVDKVLAVQALAASTGLVFAQAVAFENVVTAFCNNICVVDAVQPPYVEELCYAVKQMALIGKTVHGDAFSEHGTFSGEIPGYVAGVAKFRDWFVLPPDLSFAQSMLNSLTGLNPESPLYKEHQDVLEKVTRIYGVIDQKSAEALLHDPEIEALSSNDLASLLVKRIIGALLYDPTLPYARKNLD